MGGNQTQKWATSYGQRGNSLHPRRNTGNSKTNEKAVQIEEQNKAMTTNTNQEQVMLIANALYTEVELININHPTLGDDAKLALVAAKMLDMKTSLVSMMNERLKEGMLGSKGFGMISMFFNHYGMIQGLSKKVSMLMDLAAEIAMSDGFKPSQSISYEEALRQIIQHEYEIRGL